MRRKLAPLRSLNGCSEVFAVKNRRRMESILRRNNYGEDEELCGSRNKKKRKSKRKTTPQSRSSKKAKAKRAMNIRKLFILKRQHRQFPTCVFAVRVFMMCYSLRF
ncbi:hypothetical protein SDJN03_12894, partial [Cucurbita argyrosperma subsp. sororia]